MNTKTVYGSTILEGMSSRIFEQASKRIELLSKDKFGHTQFEIDALVSSIESQNEIAALRNLSARGKGDSVWKASVRDAFKIANHSVINDDTSHQDTRECGYRWEYKLATWAPSSQKFMASNSTFNRRVKVALFTADGSSLRSSGIYILNHRVLKDYAQYSAKSKGWQVALTHENLRDLEGFGAFRLSFPEFAKTRMDMCGCQ